MVMKRRDLTAGIFNRGLSSGGRLCGGVWILAVTLFLRLPFYTTADKHPAAHKQPNLLNGSPNNYERLACINTPVVCEHYFQ